MSFTATGVRKRNLDTDRLQGLINSDEQGFIQRMKPFNAESSARGLVDTGQGGGQQANATADIFTVVGKAINGAIGFVQSEIEVAVGDTIDFFRDNVDEVFSSYLKIKNAGVGAIIDIFNGGDFPGQILKLQGDDTDTVTINNGDDAGNTTSNIILPVGSGPSMTLGVDQLVEFIFDPLKTINGFTGAWRLTSEDTVTSGILPDGTAVNDHLEWNGGTPWVAQQFLEFHTTGPFADSGFLRFPNDQITLSSRNTANDGNLEFKVTTSDHFDLTDSSESPTILDIRTQHTSDPDNILALSVGSGVAADTLISWPNGTLKLQPAGATRFELLDDIFRKVNLDSTIPHIELFRNDSTPSADESVGHLDWAGRDLTPATVIYTSLRGISRNVTAGSGEGGFDWFFLRSGTLASEISIMSNAFAANVKTDAPVIEKSITLGAPLICPAASVKFRAFNPVISLFAITISWANVTFPALIVRTGDPTICNIVRSVELIINSVLFLLIFPNSKPTDSKFNTPPA